MTQKREEVISGANQAKRRLDMDTADLEALLEAGAESQKVDFKQSCSWNAQSFAKDILAFSNLRGGGYIIIGLKEVDGNYQREGVSAEHAAT